MLLKEFFVKLGLDVDAASWAAGDLAVKGLVGSLGLIADVARSVFGGLKEAFIDYNADIEKTKLRLAGIASMNLKVPWDKAKESADELYEGLREDAAKTPADTKELVDFATEISNAYMGATKSAKGLREFTTGAVVASKMLGMSGTAGLDIQQAIAGTVGVRDRFARAMIEGELKMTLEQFKSKKVEERVQLLAKAFNSPTVQAAMKEFESNWEGVTSTLKDNIDLIKGEVGKEFFDSLKKVLKFIGDWVQANRTKITDFFKALSKPFVAIYNIGEAVVKVIMALINWYYQAGPILGTLSTLMSAIIVAMMIFGAVSVRSALASAAAWVIAQLPLLATAALIAAIILIAEDLIVGMEGGESAIFKLFDAWSDFIDEWLTANSDNWLINALKVLWDALTHTGELWDTIVKGWGEILDNFVKWVKGLFSGLWDDIKGGASAVLDMLNPFSGIGGGDYKASDAMNKALALHPPMYGLSPIPVNRTSTASIGTLNVTTTGEPTDVAGKIRETLENFMGTHLREAAEGVR
jgi:hypothetical protein